MKTQRPGWRLPLEACCAALAGRRARVEGDIASPSVVQADQLPAPLIRLPCFGRDAAAGLLLLETVGEEDDDDGWTGPGPAAA